MIAFAVSTGESSSQLLNLDPGRDVPPQYPFHLGRDLDGWPGPQSPLLLLPFSALCLSTTPLLPSRGRQIQHHVESGAIPPLTPVSPISLTTMGSWSRWIPNGTTSPGFLGKFSLESLSQSLLLGKPKLRPSVGVFQCCHQSVKQIRELQRLHWFGCYRYCQQQPQSRHL